MVNANYLRAHRAPLRNGETVRAGPQRSKDAKRRGAPDSPLPGEGKEEARTEWRDEEAPEDDL
jgi:hypothetical protein